MSTPENSLIQVTSFYKFAKISDLKSMQSELLTAAKNLGVKGTILISEEGINGSICGKITSINDFKAILLAHQEFAGINFKDSPSKDYCFRRMFVKIKKEIITMAQPQIDPTALTGKYLEPEEFKKWRDEKKDIVIIDTRNGYEFNLGTFTEALNPNIKSFGEFPKWLDEHAEELKDKTVVTFCTGGVRCEKATAYMIEKGIEDVYQINGGILAYFEKTSASPKKTPLNEIHWTGECVVFDKRLALDPTLNPTTKRVCYVCLCEVTSPQSQAVFHPAGEVCANCEESMNKARENRINKKKSALQQVTIHIA